MNNYNIDGFNERSIYIHNSNDMNKLKNNNPTFDNSFAKMRTEERRKTIETSNNDSINVTEEVRGNINNFVIRNNNMMNANRGVNPNNPVQNALNRNMFKK